MFLSLKRKFSSALMSGLLVFVLIITIYMAQQVARLYQQYQKAQRLQGYLGDLDNVMSDTHRLQAGVETLGQQYTVVGNALKASLNINLGHDKEA